MLQKEAPAYSAERNDKNRAVLKRNCMLTFFCLLQLLTGLFQVLSILALWFVFGLVSLGLCVFFALWIQWSRLLLGHYTSLCLLLGHYISLSACYLATTFFSLHLLLGHYLSLYQPTQTTKAHTHTHTHIKKKKKTHYQTTHTMNKTDPNNNNNHKLSQLLHDQLKHSNNVNETPQTIPHMKSFGFSHHSFCCPSRRASAERPQWHSLPGA